MSQKERNEGNTDAPRVDSEYGERRGTDGGGSGPRRVKDVRTEQGSSDTREASSSTDRGTSWVSVVLGWLAALGAGLILSGIVSGIVGAIFGTAGRQGLTEGGPTAPVGVLITPLLAFLIGGYTPGGLAGPPRLQHRLPG